jgi:hypothetical protein
MRTKKSTQHPAPKHSRVVAANPRKGCSQKVKALEAHVLAKLAEYNVKLDYALTLIYKKEGGHA